MPIFTFTSYKEFKNYFVHVNNVNVRCWKHGKVFGHMRQPSMIYK